MPHSFGNVWYHTYLAFGTPKTAVAEDDVGIGFIHRSGPAVMIFRHGSSVSIVGCLGGVFLLASVFAYLLEDIGKTSSRAMAVVCY